MRPAFLLKKRNYVLNPQVAFNFISLFNFFSIVGYLSFLFFNFQKTVINYADRNIRVDF